MIGNVQESQDTRRIFKWSLSRHCSLGVAWDHVACENAWNRSVKIQAPVDCRKQGLADIQLYSTSPLKDLIASPKSSASGRSFSWQLFLSKAFMHDSSMRGRVFTVWLPDYILISTLLAVHLGYFDSWRGVRLPKMTPGVASILPIQISYSEHALQVRCYVNHHYHAWLLDRLAVEVIPYGTWLWVL